MKLHKLSLQEYLSLGYVYLIILGIISDVIYYKFLGVDILNYANILDVLISPVNILAHDARSFFFFLATTGFVFYLMIKVFPRMQAKQQIQEQAAAAAGETLTTPAPQFDNSGWINVSLVMILAMFLGYGIGKGAKTGASMRTGVHQMTHLLQFTDQQVREVKIVGQNSTYLFYLVEGQKEVTITPIADNIREIRKIHTAK
ncbi:MAG: hypothetical protein H6555_02365 [Lewinellaceae bacterium]|nr:hypothetical protein [Lewinellaceae bacterium]